MSLETTIHVGPYLACKVADDEVCPYEMAREIGEALHAVNIPHDDGDDSVYWLPNADRDPPREFTIEGDVALPLSSGDRSREILWFAQAFEREIGRLAAAYGDENVRTRWGVVAYTN